MWNNCTLQDLKTQVLKSKSYKPNIKDLQTYLATFQRYFSTYRYAANCQKVIQCFVQIFVAALHITNNHKIYQCFQKMIHWLNQDPNSRGAYYLIKSVVEICQRQFPQVMLKQDNKKKKQQSKQKQKQQQKSKQKQQKLKMREKDKTKDRDRSKQRDQQQSRSVDRRQKQQQSQQILRNNFKAVLVLVRKSGDKNMFIEDVYQVFVEYYLQRIAKQVQQYASRNAQTASQPKNKQKPLNFGSNVLTCLSNILSARNKTQVSTIAKQHIVQSSGSNNSSYIGLYLLLQLPNISQLLSSSLNTKSQQATTSSKQDQDRIIYHKNIEQSIQNYLQQNEQKKNDDIFLFIINKIFNLFKFCIENQNYKMIPDLYKLYPIALQNSQDLLDRLYLHMLFDLEYIQIKMIDKYRGNVQQQYISQHFQYIQSTSIRKLDNQNFNNRSSMLNIKYVVKLYILVLFICNNKIQHEKPAGEKLSKRIIEKAVQYSNNLSSEQIAIFIDNIYKMQNDCKMVICTYLRYKQKQNNTSCKFSSEENTEKATLRYMQHMKQLQQWKILINKLKQCQRKQQKAQILELMQNKISQKDKNFLFQSWKIALQSLFQLNIAKKQPQNYAYEQYYSQQALNTLAYLSLRPSLLPKPSPQNSNYFKITPLSNACLQTLQLIIQKIDKEQIIGHIKKIMLDVFDKVDQQVIRDIIVPNIFLSKCLLLTNHIPKCKFLMELLVRQCEQPGRKYEKRQQQEYLRLLLPAVPDTLLLDYCRYIANRDKLQMRLALFQKQCVKFQSLMDASLSDVAIKGIDNAMIMQYQ